MAGPKPIPLSIRFQRHVGPAGPTGCTLWTGVQNGQGYGRMGVSSTKKAMAHRVAWELVNGPVPDGMKVLHRCDVKLCVNPDHLFLGTQLDNMRDMAKKNRSNLGERCPSHKLTADQVAAIRIAYVAGAKKSDLARQYGVAGPTIGGCITGKTWRHLLTTG